MRLCVRLLPFPEFDDIRVGWYAYKVVFRIGKWHLLWRY